MNWNGEKGKSGKETSSADNEGIEYIWIYYIKELKPRHNIIKEWGIHEIMVKDVRMHSF